MVNIEINIIGDVGNINFSTDFSSGQGRVSKSGVPRKVLSDAETRKNPSLNVTPFVPSRAVETMAYWVIKEIWVDGPDSAGDDDILSYKIGEEYDPDLAMSVVKNIKGLTIDDFSKRVVGRLNQGRQITSQQLEEMADDVSSRLKHKFLREDSSPVTIP